MPNPEHGFSLLDDVLMKTNIEWRLEDERIKNDVTYNEGKSPLDQAILKISQTLDTVIEKKEKLQEHRSRSAWFDIW
jgi:hypothetical protein